MAERGKLLSVGRWDPGSSDSCVLRWQRTQSAFRAQIPELDKSVPSSHSRLRVLCVLTKGCFRMGCWKADWWIHQGHALRKTVPTVPWHQQGTQWKECQRIWSYTVLGSILDSATCLAVCLQGADFTSLGLSFFICKVGLMLPMLQILCNRGRIQLAVKNVGSEIFIGALVIKLLEPRSPLRSEWINRGVFTQ